MVESPAYDHNYAVEVRNAAGGFQKVTFKDVKDFLCPDATDGEITLFLKTAEVEQLNPFTKEIELIKYAKDSPASIVIRMDARLKVAESRREFAYAKAGIIIQSKDATIRWIEGTFYDKKTDELIGGWSKVFLKTRKEPVFTSVPLQEVLQYTRDGNITRFWKTMPATMVRKVAYYRALHEAFPGLFHGPVSPEEEAKSVVEENYQEVKNETTAGAPETEPPPGPEPPQEGIKEAFMNDNDPNWNLFWAKQKEKGLTTDAVHQYLTVNSIKVDWLGKGRTLEEADNLINEALKPPQPAATDTKSGEENITWEELQSASTTSQEQSEQPSTKSPDGPWEYSQVAMTVKVLQAKGVKQLLGKDFSDRMNMNFKVELPAGKKPDLKTVYGLLTKEKKLEFCHWIADLEAMAGG